MDLIKYFENEEKLEKLKINEGKLTDKEERILRSLERQVIRTRLKIGMMNEFDQKYVILRFKLKLSFKKIGEILGVSKSKAVKYEKRLLESLK